MIELRRLADLSSILELKAQYLKSLVAPMDGMWDAGFTDPAPHWEIRLHGDLAGYCAINDEGALLQFFVAPGYEEHGRALLDQVIAQDSVKEAVVSTIDPAWLSLCLEKHDQLTVHTHLYEMQEPVRPNRSDARDLDFRLIEASELERTIAFQQACLGGDQDLTGWLRGYSANLINRKELFALDAGNEWLGIGECRNSDSQEGIADVGVMVYPERRGNGWASHILSLLVEHGSAHGKHLICSTTVENVASQKAIERAGFRSRHRILTFTF